METHLKVSNKHNKATYEYFLRQQNKHLNDADCLLKKHISYILAVPLVWTFPWVEQLDATILLLPFHEINSNYWIENSHSINITFNHVFIFHVLLN